MRSEALSEVINREESGTSKASDFRGGKYLKQVRYLGLARLMKYKINFGVGNG